MLEVYFSNVLLLQDNQSKLMHTCIRQPRNNTKYTNRNARRRKPTSSKCSKLLVPKLSPWRFFFCLEWATQSLYYYMIFNYFWKSFSISVVTFTAMWLINIFKNEPLKWALLKIASCAYILWYNKDSLENIQVTSFKHTLLYTHYIAKTYIN